MGSSPTVFHSHDLEDVRSAQRAREFHRYLHPVNLAPCEQRSQHAESDFDSVPSLSQLLSPLCQLTTLQCRAKKAMINCMDRDVMYFLTEATARRTSVEGKELHEFIHDPILASCMAVSLKGRICEMTINLPDRPDNRPPLFVVPDLKNSQFAHMSIISGPPYYRFYAGMPIRTKNGINIGSLAIMDDRPRDCLTGAEEDFMQKTVSQIMTYLEMNWQVLDNIRMRRMMKGLTNFISNPRDIQPEGSISLTSQPPQSDHQNVYGVQLNSREPVESLSPNQPEDSDYPFLLHEPAPVEAMNGSEAHDKVPDASETLAVKNTDYQAQAYILKIELLRRAAVSIVRSLDLHKDSAAIFFSVGAQTENSQAPDPSSNSVVAIAGDETEPLNIDHSLCQEINAEFMRALSRRHPKGCLWNFGSEPQLNRTKWDSEVVYDDSDDKFRDKADLERVKAAFPSANQLLFVPVFDLDSVRPSFCLFVQSCEDSYCFDINTDLSFLHAFCSTISTDIGRIEAWRSDKHQSDFVSNISHEMRSPLHGILLSTQFLRESGLTDFQRTMLTTIDQCSGTLLDTMNNVLDYSKINALGKRWSSADEANFDDSTTPGDFSQGISTAAPPLLQLFATTDICAVLEQVVDGLILSHAYNTTVEITDVSHQARGKKGPSRPALRNTARSASIQRPQIVLDVEKGDWVFATQPGAIRRLVGNLVGNALKYTHKGRINISLRFTDSGSGQGSKTVTLTVADTGIGMSQRFLESKLYRPFSQEDHLSPGTGLGLSIVHSIATMMDGTVGLQSAIGQGTKVVVTLPLQRPVPGRGSTHGTPGSLDSEQSDISPFRLSSFLEAESSLLTMSSYGALSLNQDNLQEALYSCYNDWFQLKSNGSWWDTNVVNMMVDDMEDFFRDIRTRKSQYLAVIALYKVEDSHRLAEIYNQTRQDTVAIQFVSIPFGPHKLAKAIKAVVDGQKNVIIHDTATLQDLTGHDRLIRTQTLQQQLEPDEGDRVSEIGKNSTDDTSSLKDVMGLSTAELDTQSSTCTTNSIFSDKVTSSFPFPTQPQVQPPHLSGNGPYTADLASRTMKASISSSKEPVELSEQTLFGNPRILIVDDNAINLRLLETYLRKKRGYTRVTKATNGQEAFDAFVTVASFQDSRFELIFMDISMPIMNGFDATRKIRQHENALRLRHGDDADDVAQEQGHPGQNTSIRTSALIVALTGLASGKDQAEGFESGLDVYMTKPVDFKDLSRFLDSWELHQRDDESMADKATRKHRARGNAAGT